MSTFYAIFTISSLFLTTFLAGGISGFFYGVYMTHKTIADKERKEKIEKHREEQ